MAAVTGGSWFHRAFLNIVGQQALSLSSLIHGACGWKALVSHVGKEASCGCRTHRLPFCIVGLFLFTRSQVCQMAPLLFIIMLCAQFRCCMKFTYLQPSQMLLETMLPVMWLMEDHMLETSLKKSDFLSTCFEPSAILSDHLTVVQALNWPWNGSWGVPLPPHEGEKLMFLWTLGICRRLCLCMQIIIKRSMFNIPQTSGMKVVLHLTLR